MAGNTPELQEEKLIDLEYKRWLFEEKVAAHHREIIDLPVHNYKRQMTSDNYNRLDELEKSETLKAFKETEQYKRYKKLKDLIKFEGRWHHRNPQSYKKDKNTPEFQELEELEEPQAKKEQDVEHAKEIWRKIWVPYMKFAEETEQLFPEGVGEYKGASAAIYTLYQESFKKYIALLKKLGEKNASSESDYEKDCNRKKALESKCGGHMATYTEECYLENEMLKAIAADRNSNTEPTRLVTFIKKNLEVLKEKLKNRVPVLKAVSGLLKNKEENDITEDIRTEILALAEVKEALEQKATFETYKKNLNVPSLKTQRKQGSGDKKERRRSSSLH